MKRNRFATLAFAVLLGPAPALAAADDIVFVANLSADEETAPTYSEGRGRAEVVLERATLRITWNVTFSGLSSAATGVHIHGPDLRGSNAGIQVNLAPKGAGTALPLQGSVELDEGQFQYLIAGRMYVNIHTAKYEQGELRGQLVRQRRPEPVTN